MKEKTNGKGKFVLKTKGFRSEWLRQAGYTVDADGKHYPATVTTHHIERAQRFPTYRQAERMKELLNERYGVSSMIMEV